jgi:hypothetical protein
MIKGICDNLYLDTLFLTYNTHKVYHIMNCCIET